MSGRVKRFAAGLFTGYVALALNIVYTVLSVPMALHYLSKPEFGLWALALQISGYLMLLDLGVSSALHRLLANHKDTLNAGHYGSLLLTAAMVFGVQGLMIATVGVAFSFCAPALFSIPQELQGVFRNVLLILTVFTGISLAFRSVGSPLWAFQRTDVWNFSAIITLVANFFSLWIGFAMGMGVYSFATAGILSLLLRAVFESTVCMKNGYYPDWGSWGRPSWYIFREVFGFGKDVFLMSIGGQLVNASQIMIISRCVGLEAAAAFSIGTKIFNMGQQLVSKIMETSNPALTEMFVHGDIGRMKHRFWNIISLTVFASSFMGGGVILANRAVVQVWTSKIISWNSEADMLLGGLLLVTSVSKCFVALFGMAGNYAPVRHIYAIEGILFAFLSIPAAKYFGINGVLSVSLIAHIASSFLIALFASRKYLHPFRKLLQYGTPGLAILMMACIASILLQNGSLSAINTILLSVLMAILIGTAGWKYVLDAELRQEILEKAAGLLRC
jgi:O-antigen/teichoic acid export membrane protein